ncbi:hypothetical protein B0H19DRAFT_1103846 [Mycena capillaripes]|nr:hypothetical protein B0H19DRAFT_1103846 [Mycena capillaripes]
MSAIDDEIAWHYAQIALLKDKRNALAPVQRLPNELMTRILTIYAVESDTLFNLKWTKVMYVCRHWHALGLAAQSLWAFIDLKWNGNFHRLYAQLTRSGAAPLTLKVDLFNACRYTDIILDHSERVCELEVGGEAKFVYELIAGLLDHNFPILSSLSLDPSFKQDELEDGFVEALPDTLFEGRLPSLRELILTSIAFPWTLLSGLTTLSLTRCTNSLPSAPPTFNGFLEMLSSCPQLRNLKLDTIIPPLAAPDQLYTTVDLPAMAWLRLRDHVGLCGALLEHLRIPPTASIQILFGGVRTGAAIKDILVPIRKHTRSPGAQKPVLLQIDRSRLYCTMSLFCDTAPHDFLARDSPNCPLALNFHPDTEGGLRQILTKILKAIPSESIAHLDARGASDVRQVSWRTVMKLLPALETVYLQVNAGGVNCVNALSQIEPLDQPRIRRLHIRIFRPEARDDTIIVLLAALEECLQVCHTHGDPFQRLEFEDRDYVLAGREEKLERLFALMGGEVVWNGVDYDPVRRKKQLEEWEAERRALAAEYGIEM